MSETQVLTVGKYGEIQVPDEIRNRYHLEPETPVRIVETRAGILIVPLTAAENDSELKTELAHWQEFTLSNWNQFPYEDV